jgi:protein O-GlcNAc transferase
MNAPLSTNQAAELSDPRALADAARAQGLWAEALVQYQNLPNSLTNSAVLHNMGVCCLGLGMYKRALSLAARALELQPSLWQARLVAANANKNLGNKAQWILDLQSLFELNPNLPDVRMEYASALMNSLGDAKSAREMIKPLIKDPKYTEQAQLLRLMSLLYDRPSALSASVLSSEIMEYANHFLSIKLDTSNAYDRLVKMAVQDFKASEYPPKKVGKRRVGLISALFTASPVYFLTIDALERMAADGHELVFLSRSRRQDWATEKFKSIATAWVDLTPYDAPQIEALIKACELDELFDLAGWTDVQVLKALAQKPAPAQYKWVGGQSCTTGLKTFDGFITDDVHTPRESYKLYSEPLLSLGPHYVHYTPPPYMPAPRARGSVSLKSLKDKGQGHLGIIANPVKLSEAFLKVFSGTLKSLPAGVKVSLVDQRYQYTATKQRIVDALGPWADRVEFLHPKNHPEFLDLLNSLDLIVDTFPYSGGLTVCEAIHLGVPIHYYQVERQLFCERHVLSHLEA